MDAILYIRFSTAEQKTGDSYDRQKRDGLAYIEKQGWRHVDTIQDLGKSAWKGEHMLEAGALGKFTSQVAAGDIPKGTVLVAEKTDRLSREGWETLFDWLRSMTRKGISVATLDGHLFSPETMRDELSIIKILLGGKADQAFSEKISERVVSKYAKKVEEAANGGPKVSGKCPGWMTLNEDRMDFTYDKVRIAVVEDIYEQAAAGRGARWIAKNLNERGIRPWGKKFLAGEGWDPTTINWIIQSPAVEGEFRVGYSNPGRVKTPPRTIPGYYRRIVDADLVARARAAFASRKTVGGGRHTSTAVNLFRGLIRCGSCGSRMYLNSRHNRYALQCVSAGGSRGCEAKETYHYEAFETTALDTILDLALDDRWFSKADDTYPLTVALAEAQKRLVDHEARLQRAVDKVLDDEVGELFAARLPSLKRAVQDAANEVSETEKALARARGVVSANEHQKRVLEVRGAIEDPDPAIREASRLKVIQAMQGIVESVTCDLYSEYGRCFKITLKTGAYNIVIGDDGVVWEQNYDAEFYFGDNTDHLTQGDSAAGRLLADIRRRWTAET
ncbi:MAG: recombinase family protein [Rhizobiaceae bacterium]|nr:recombinase family protein [Rhizobiaceae bacterium]